MIRYTTPFTVMKEEFDDGLLWSKKGTRITASALLLQTVGAYAVLVSAACWHDVVEVRRRWFKVEEEVVFRYSVLLQIFSNGKEAHWQRESGEISELEENGVVPGLTFTVDQNLVRVQLLQPFSDPEFSEQCLALICEPV